MAKQFTPFYLVLISPWPWLIAWSCFAAAIGFISWIRHYSLGGFTHLIGLLFILIILCCWFRDLIRENFLLGQHSTIIRSGFTNAFLIFLISEIFFFGGFIFAYFYSALHTNWAIGFIWPPFGLQPVYPFGLPLLNTFLLLTSSATATLAHNAILSQQRTPATLAFFATILLGLFFTLIQLLEFFEASFDFCDSIYGTVFFSTLALHGLHVIIGLVFIFVCFQRFFTYQLTVSNHISFESALIYWHLIDLIWLLLFSFFYCWAYS